MKKSKSIGLVLSLATFGLVAAGCGVSNGNVGIEITPTGKVVSETPLGTGFHFTLINDIIEYPIKMVEVPYNFSEDGKGAITVATNDGKRMDIEMKIAYHTEPKSVLGIYKKFGNVTQADMEAGWLRSQTQNAMREEYSKHATLDVLTSKVPTLEMDVHKNIETRFAKEGFILDEVTLGVPEVDSATQETIDAIIASTQANEKAKKDAETDLTKARSKAEVAKANADSKLYQAQKEAEANKALAQSITKELVDYKEAEAREKHGWVTVTAGQPIVDTGK